MILAIALAAAAPPSAAPVLQIYCHMGECSWSRAVSNQPVRTTRDGTLRKYVAFNGSSVHPDGYPDRWSPSVRIKWGKTPDTDYVFCSRRQPALAFRDDKPGHWIAHVLDLFDLYGYNTASAVIYLRACHDLDLNARDIQKRLRALGYRPGTRSEQVDIRSPEQLVALPAGG
jgi:hypothetical protein